MKYIEVTDTKSLRSALEQVEGHGHVRLMSGNFNGDISITRPIKLSGSPEAYISGSIAVQSGVQTVFLENLQITSRTTPLVIDSARDVSVTGCHLTFSDTAVRMSGVNIIITGCEFSQRGVVNPYSCIVMGGCINPIISNNTHVKRESSLHTFVKILPETCSGIVNVSSNNVDVKIGSPGNFIHAHLIKCGTRKIRFGVTGNTFNTSQTASGGFLVIESKNPKLFTDVLDHDTPGTISGNRVFNPYRGWVFLDVVDVPIAKKTYFNIYDNTYSGIYTPKPLCHVVNDSIMLSQGLSQEVLPWEHFICKNIEIPVQSTTTTESPQTIIFTLLFAGLVVFLTIMFIRYMQRK